VGVGIWDITSDVGVPAYGCIVFDRPGAHVTGKFAGYGAHLAVEVALSRALCEAVQSRLTYVSGSRDDIRAADYDEVRNEDDIRELREALVTPPPPVRFGDRVSSATDSLDGDVERLLSAVRDVGVDSVVIVNLAKHDVAIPVVKVIVPGLENGVTPNMQPGERLRRKLASRR
jgi:ribosomal protein S12 methylthiotransferase accessory factor